jgi:hypothetical protein
MVSMLAARLKLFQLSFVHTNSGASVFSSPSDFFSPSVQFLRQELSYLSVQFFSLSKIGQMQKNRIRFFPGVDVMITIFCDFCQFLAKKLAFSQKPML